MKTSHFSIVLLLFVGVSILACTQGPESETALDSGSVLDFIEDDYSTALAKARARDVPLFIESWAPW
jgi:hypothetical protein